MYTKDICEKNEIEFAFSLLEVDPEDIHSNIKKLHENGLSDKAALQALIDVPAKLLKVDNRLGSIEKGKIANLVILKHQYLQDEFDPEYLLSGGHLFDYTREESKKGTLKSEAKFEHYGTYKVNIQLGSTAPKGTFQLSYENEKAAGSINLSSISDPVQLKNIELGKKSLQAEFETSFQGSLISGKILMSFTEDALTGTVDLGNDQIFPIEGELQANPE